MAAIDNIGCARIIYSKNRLQITNLVCNYAGKDIVNTKKSTYLYKFGNPCSECPKTLQCSTAWTGLCEDCENPKRFKKQHALYDHKQQNYYQNIPPDFIVPQQPNFQQNNYQKHPSSYYIQPPDTVLNPPSPNSYQQSYLPETYQEEKQNYPPNNYQQENQNYLPNNYQEEKQVYYQQENQNLPHNYQPAKQNYSPENFQLQNKYYLDGYQQETQNHSPNNYVGNQNYYQQPNNMQMQNVYRQIPNYSAELPQNIRSYIFENVAPIAQSEIEPAVADSNLFEDIKDTMVGRKDETYPQMLKEDSIQEEEPAKMPLNMNYDYSDSDNIKQENFERQDQDYAQILKEEILPKRKEISQNKKNNGRCFKKTLRTFS